MIFFKLKIVPYFQFRASEYKFLFVPDIFADFQEKSPICTQGIKNCQKREKSPIVATMFFELNIEKFGILWHLWTPKKSIHTGVNSFQGEAPICIPGPGIQTSMYTWSKLFKPVWIPGHVYISVWIPGPDIHTGVYTYDI